MKKTIFFLFIASTLVSCLKTGLEDNSVPEVTTLPVEVATSSTAVLRGSTKGGTANMICRGVCFSSSDIFSFKDSPCISSEAGEGEFSARTYELIPNHKYNMKAFAVLKDGTIVYGEAMTFSTTDFQLPTVEVLDATEIYSTEATLNGKLLAEGDYAVTTKGFVYTSDTEAVLELGQENVMSALGTDGVGGFSATVGELGIGVTYRMRAYAMTENGPGYSSEKSFTTLDIHPVEFSQIEVLENTYSSLKVKSSITDARGATVTSFGFCWSSTNKLPTIKNSDYKALDGAFEMSFEDVRPGKIYHVRPYAIASETGTNYGPVASVRVVTYDCDGGMIKVVPNNPVYLGWLGDYENPSLPAKFSQAHDGEFGPNQSVGKSNTPIPSEATIKPFCIAKYEVTNRWFCNFLNAYGSATVKEGTWKGESILFDAYTDITYNGEVWTVDSQYLDCPVVGVTFYGALAFCEFFGGYLPNEAQWEIAARGNVYSNDPSKPMYRYSGSDNLDDVAIWSNGVSRLHVETVGQKKPNQLGIYDMSGNAQEMTSSWYGYYSAVYKENPMSANKNITVRGGRAQRGLASSFQNCSRDAYTVTAPVTYSNYIGFRFACDPSDED